MPTISALPPALAQDLAACVGADQVLTEPGDLYLYSFDSALDRSLPSAVVLPGTPDEVARVVRVLAKHKRAFVARGAATSLCGGPVPLQNGVVVSLARLKKMGKVDAVRREILVEPGVINQRLQQAVAAQGLFYPPDPGSQKACTIGGNVATNAGGPHCLKYGVTCNFVAGLDLVLPDGQPLLVRVDDPGYDLTGFFVGSEGTLGIATRVRLKLLPKPAQIRTMLASFPSIEDAIQAVTDIIGAGLLPATLEAMDRTTIEAVEAFVHAGYPTDAEAVLLIEVDGDKDAKLDEQAARIQAICQKNNQQEFRFAKDEEERQKLWEGRRGAYPAMARLAPNVLVEDGAVPRTRLPEALAAIKKIAEDADIRVALLFHAGDGNLHPNIIFDERDEEQTRIVKEAGYKMLKVCVDLGGTISGEHGIGSDKREAMKWLFSRETLALFRRLKNAFDPENLCNPDKLIPLVSSPARAEDVATEAVADNGLVVPENEEQLVRLVQSFRKNKTFFGVQGTASRYRIRESLAVSTRKLSAVVDFDQGNLTLTAQAGALLPDLRALVEKEGRYLWIAGAGSVAGAIATRASVVPPLRDLILGMRILLPTGEVATLGAKTMKNVAGYDAAKLLIGSWGTLGVILDVTLRLFPYPPPQLRDAPVAPFVFADIHRRIKKAFDPDGILAVRTSMLTADEINARPKNEPAAPEPEKLPDNVGDKFWF